MRAFGIALFLFFAFVAVRSQDCSEAKVLAEAQKIQLNQSPRLRRDWTDLSQTEKTAFLNALVKLDSSGWLAEFQCYHLSETRLPSPNTDIIHRTPIFLLWHRIFLWHIESKLIELGVPGLPYWSFEYNSVDPKNGAVFTPDAFGKTDVKSGCAVLDNSILKGINLRQSIYANSGCIKRNPDNSAPLYDDAYMARVATNSQTFAEMHSGYGGPHAVYHNYWGSGSFLRGMASPRDPVFWLYHSNIDRHLTIWQKKHPNALYPYSQKTLSRYPISPSTSLDLRSLNVTYRDPDPANQAKRLTNLVNGAVSGLSGQTGMKKRSINVDECLSELSANFLATPAPASETFKRFLSPRGAPKNTFRLFLDTMDKGYDLLSDDELVVMAADNIRFDPYLNFYAHLGALYEDLDTCTNGILREYGAKITERGVLLTTMLDTLKHDDDLRATLSQYPMLISRSLEATVDAASLDELNEAGSKLTSLIIGLVGATATFGESTTEERRKRSIEDVPAGWTCDPSRFGAKDGCDCGCGIPDPDCPDQRAADSFSGEPVPIFGCPKRPNMACVSGVCVSSGAPPSSWKCHPGDYNSTNGCDCNCGSYDPDCGVTFPARYKKVAKYLFGISGCSNGIKPTCSLAGTCKYTREVPQAWKCPNVQYGSKDGCHCSCGAYDPDCDDPKQKISGCHCLNMTCSHGGFCQGICGGYAIYVRGAAEAPADSNGSSSSSSSGLSGGAIAGIVVGSVVGALLLVAIIAFLMKGKSGNYSAVMQE